MVHSYLGNIRDREVTKIIDMVCLSQLQRCNYLVIDTVLFNKFVLQNSLNFEGGEN